MLETNVLLAFIASLAFVAAVCWMCMHDDRRKQEMRKVCGYTMEELEEDKRLTTYFHDRCATCDFALAFHRRESQV